MNFENENVNTKVGYDDQDSNEFTLITNKIIYHFTSQTTRCKVIVFYGPESSLQPSSAVIWVLIY